MGRIYDAGLSFVYDSQYSKLLQRAKDNGYIQSVTREELRAYKARWAPLGRSVNAVYYKLFSAYVGKDLNLIPEDIAHSVVEALLNPPAQRGPFSDKNLFDRIVGPKMMPRTFLRCMDGVFYDADYHLWRGDDKGFYALFSSQSRLVVKATVDTSSGLDVLLFERNDSGWCDSTNGEVLTLAYLQNRLGDNFIVQECLMQYAFMAQSCRTAVNTLRLLVYRSVKDDSIHLCNAIMRIGRDGSFLDNAHQGGASIGITADGELRKSLVNQYGDRFTIFNGIDYSKQTYQIPQWTKIEEFAKTVAAQIPFHRVLNLDVMIDADGQPRLIEYNIRSMGVWVYQFNNGSCFGSYTDEIIDYCAAHRKEIKSEYLYL